MWTECDVMKKITNISSFYLTHMRVRAHTYKTTTILKVVKTDVNESWYLTRMDDEANEIETQGVKIKTKYFSFHENNL